MLHANSNFQSAKLSLQSLRENIKQEYRDVVDRTVFTGSSI